MAKGDARKKAVSTKGSGGKKAPARKAAPAKPANGASGKTARAEEALAKTAPAKKPPAKKASAKKASAKKAPAKKAPAKKASATKAPAKKASATKASASKAPAKKAPAKKAPAKKAPATNGVVFEDPGFRLAVINALLAKGHFRKELAAAEAAGGDVEPYAIDPVVQRAIDGFVITPELLAQVTELAPDGGDDIYAALIPEWDGESDELDIGSLEDLALLPALKKLALYSMCSKGIDLRPIGSVPTLEHVHVSFSESWATGHEVLAALAARGVSVKR